jgi:peptidoglycan/xylan/chitin deacetylase (PgdA/CDA1 family)
MQSITIGFHDVVEDLQEAHPIAPGHTVMYTVDRAQLRNHLHAIRSCVGAYGVGRVDRISPDSAHPFVALTFDDGAASSYACVAPELEAFGWPGHFFVTTDWIGARGFLDKRQIRELEQRGHLIGTHSRTHPGRMSELGWDEIVREWTGSCLRLAEILGHPVTVASVPGGYFNRAVARAAAAAGIKALFTSEPTTAAQTIDGCTVLGRYAIRRNTSPRFSAAVVSRDVWPRTQQAATWVLKKAAKKIAGPFYERARGLLLRDLPNVHGSSAT